MHGDALGKLFIVMERQEGDDNGVAEQWFLAGDGTRSGWGRVTLEDYWHQEHLSAGFDVSREERERR